MKSAAPPGYVRRFPLFWGMLTAVYACAVTYRAVAFDIGPGLPTSAGFAAVVAVWLDFFALVRDRLVLRIGVLACLFGAATINTAIIVTRTLEESDLSLGRSAVTLLFLILFCVKTREVLRTDLKAEG